MLARKCCQNRPPLEAHQHLDVGSVKPDGTRTLKQLNIDHLYPAACMCVRSWNSTGDKNPHEKGGLLLYSKPFSTISRTRGLIRSYGRSIAWAGTLGGRTLRSTPGFQRAKQTKQVDIHQNGAANVHSCTSLGHRARR